MKALITGGAGFIGSHLAEELLNRGQEVIAFDDLSTGAVDNITHLRSAAAFSFHQGTVLDVSDLTPLVRRSDVVYHLAAAVGVKYVLENAVSALEVNGRGTENVLRLAETHGKKKVIIASSSEVYGKTTKFPFKEDDDALIGPTSVSRWGYSCAKAFDEFLALAYHREKDLPVVLLRFFNTVGPRQRGRYGMVMPRFVAQALKDGPITVYGDGGQSRTFSYVKDVVKAVADIALVPSAEGQVFNIGSDKEISINELAGLVREVLNSKSEVVHAPFSEVYDKDFEEARRRLPDISKIKGFIDFQPATDLPIMVREIADHQRQGKENGIKASRV